MLISNFPKSGYWMWGSGQIRISDFIRVAWWVVALCNDHCQLTAEVKCEGLTATVSHWTCCFVPSPAGLAHW